MEVFRFTPQPRYLPGICPAELQRMSTKFDTMVSAVYIVGLFFFYFGTNMSSINRVLHEGHVEPCFPNTAGR
jgi:hypothetical protein